jgi:hypothetical protein
VLSFVREPHSWDLGPKPGTDTGECGEWFADRIKEHDIVLLAHGRKRFVIGWGVVVSKAKKGHGVVNANDGTPLYYQMRRDLDPFRSKGSSFPRTLARHIPGYNGVATGAIYRFNKKKPGQKKVCDWLEGRLGKSSPEEPPDHALREEPPPPAKKGKGSGYGAGGPPLPDSKLGDAGELLVLEYEKSRLLDAGRADLEKRVRHVAKEKGGAAKGYDILSFDPQNGSEKRIEVKTTRGSKASAFYLTRGEVRCSEQHPSSYYLYRVFSFGKRPAFYKRKGRLNANFVLDDPMVYRVSKLADKASN